MSKDQSTVQPEDIELDEVGAESVVGGAGAHAKKHVMSIAEAEKAGYKEVACERGGVLMKNSAGHTIVAQ